MKKPQQSERETLERAANLSAIYAGETLRQKVANLPNVAAAIEAEKLEVNRNLLCRVWCCLYSPSQKSVHVSTLDTVVFDNLRMLKRGKFSDWAVHYAGDEENARKVAERLMDLRDRVVCESFKTEAA